VTGPSPTASRERILSGFRPTGPTHVGHLVGALGNWVELQEQHDCFFFIADWHALTSDYGDTSRLRGYVLELAADWLAVGLDPKRAALFVQSDVPEHAELYLLLGMITPLGWLERVPTYKEQKAQIQGKDLETYGFLGYPVLQAADILLYKPRWVPVGEDQVAHLELVREIARRFNGLYGPVFPEPQPKLTSSPRLPGTDGRKMSKSYGNAIGLGEEPGAIRERVRGMVTDPARARRSDPGNPEVCPVFAFHRVFSPPTQVARIDAECRTAAIGCTDCKALMADRLVERLTPIRDRRTATLARPDTLRDMLADGARRARAVAAATLAEARRAMGLA